MIAESRGNHARETAESLAVEAFGWLASDDDALTRFMGLSGMAPEDLRHAASNPGFLAAVLDFVAAEDATVLAFASHAGVKPERIITAQRILNGHD